MNRILKSLTLLFLMIVFSVSAFGAGGGNNRCRVLWDQAQGKWIESIANAPMATPTPGTCPAGSVQWTTGVSDHKGITFGSVTGTGYSEKATYTQPVTCSCTQGSSFTTISGYTPTTADQGKDLVIGCNAGLNGGSDFHGAGGNGGACQTLRVHIGSVSGQTINFGSAIGTSPTSCQNTVTNAECDIGTDNSPTLNTFLNAQTAGATACIPAGNYQMDATTAVHVTKNLTLFCQPGAIFYEVRNDAWTANDFFQSHALMTFEGLTAGGINGCTAVGTNPGVVWNGGTYSGFSGANIPNNNGHTFWQIYHSSNMVMQNLVDLNVWGDADIQLYPFSTTIGSDFNTVQNNFTQGGWTYGPSIIAGAHNTFTNNVMRDVGYDIEPNDAPTANLTHDNVFNGFFSSNQADYPTGYNAAHPMPLSFGGNAICEGSTACSTTQTIGLGGNMQGFGNIWVPCNGSAIADTWTRLSITSNSTGSPICACDSSC